ncbi:MAG TPA: KH domain-containing protein, partial [Nocardioidaceae bacterium]|nr:KH domain-containing protein [Nocardioidaceae bacterium]
MAESTITTSAPTQHTITIPASVPMVSVLGPGDEFLKIIEREFAADIHSRGNTVTVSGSPAEAALVERLMDELVTIVRHGQGLTAS